MERSPNKVTVLLEDCGRIDALMKLTFNDFLAHAAEVNAQCQEIGISAEFLKSNSFEKVMNEISKRLGMAHPGKP